MDITEVRIKLVEDNNERLQAFCSVTIDDAFVVRDLKIIQGLKGSFVAMPSRKLTDRCNCCGYKNHLRARFCNQCGSKLDEERCSRDADGRVKLHADIAHPINSLCRERMQAVILHAYSEELEKSKLPGYRCSYDDFDNDFDPTYEDVLTSTHRPPSAMPQRATGTTGMPASMPAVSGRPMLKARSVESFEND